MSLRAMSFSLHSEPRYRLLFEGGEAGSFNELRLRAVDGAVIASGNPVPSASEGIQVCSRSKTAQPTVYGALRVTLSLASQEQLNDVIRYPERYRVEVLARGEWQQAGFVFACHAQE